MERTVLWIVIGVGALALATWCGVATELWQPRSKRHVRALVRAETFLVLLGLGLLAFLSVDATQNISPVAPVGIVLAYKLWHQRFCSSCGHRVTGTLATIGKRASAKPAVHCRLCAQPLVRLRDLRVSAS